MASEIVEIVLEVVLVVDSMLLKPCGVQEKVPQVLFWCPIVNWTICLFDQAIYVFISLYFLSILALNELTDFAYIAFDGTASN